MATINRISLLGVPFDNVSLAETILFIDESIQSKGFIQHIVVNVAKIVNARVDTQLLKSISESNLINVDGMGVIYGARLFGMHIIERVAGIDLFESLLELSSTKGYRVFFLGAKEDVLAKTISNVLDKHPNLTIAGSHHGYFWDDEESIVQMVRESGAQLLFVAITSPQKEVFINKWKTDLGVNFVMGVGGTFDIYAGITKRAPKWMQQIGLEWFFRVLQEPSRMWWRYLRTNSIFLLLLIHELFKFSFINTKDSKKL